MTIVEKIDYTLICLYKETKDGHMVRIKKAFAENEQDLTISELREIKKVIENYGYAVFQTEPRGEDYRGQITKKGILFVENDSFSKQGTSILNLEN